MNCLQQTTNKTYKQEEKTFGRRRKKLEDFFLIKPGRVSWMFGCEVILGDVIGSFISRTLEGQLRSKGNKTCTEATTFVL